MGGDYLLEPHNTLFWPEKPDKADLLPATFHLHNDVATIYSELFFFQSLLTGSKLYRLHQ